MIRLALLLVLMSTPTLASAPQTAPDTPRAHGCAVILPEPGEHDGGTALQVRTARPLSECDGSAPVSYGASIRDSGTGTRR